VEAALGKISLAVTDNLSPVGCMHQTAVHTSVGKVSAALTNLLSYNLPLYSPCSEFNKAVVQAKDDLCCAVVTAATYHTAGWFGFGLFTALLGVPCAILGFKRFANQIWVRFSCSSSSYS
jgi:hypothetical protein